MGYILAVGLLAGESWEDCVDNVKTKIKPITFTAWKFWPLIHCITYTVIPAQHRILWVNCVDLVWNAILALMAGEKTDEVEKLDDYLMNANATNDTMSSFSIVANDTVKIIEDSLVNQTMSHYNIVLNDTMKIIENFLVNETVSLQFSSE